MHVLFFYSQLLAWCLSRLLLLSLRFVCGWISFLSGFTNTHTAISRLFVRAEQYEKDIKLKQNISFDTCFFHFYPIYDSRNLLQRDYVFCNGCFASAHFAGYRPELLFKDHYLSQGFANELKKVYRKSIISESMIVWRRWNRYSVSLLLRYLWRLFIWSNQLHAKPQSH